MTGKRKRLPEWLRQKNLLNRKMIETRKILKEFELHSVCQSARCPNIGECFASKTATFMILGDACTRNCRFCAVKTEDPAPLDEKEPVQLARAVEKLGLRHVVITSVTRDDLPDGGAQQFVRTIDSIRKLDSEIIIEILTPDFRMNRDAIEKVVTAEPDIYNHNVETVPRLYSRVRPQAIYQRSLDVLHYVKELNNSIYTKSGIMVGLGEKEDEVVGVMKDLREIGCDIFTIGQYLQPTGDHLSVVEYVKPEQFDHYRDIGQELGFKYIASGPYVRSSYHARDFSEEYMAGN